MDWDETEVEFDHFSDDHPANYDQKKAEAVEILNKSNGYILYAFVPDEEQEEDGVRGMGNVIISKAPGQTTAVFVEAGLSAILETVTDMFKRMGVDLDRETEG